MEYFDKTQNLLHIEARILNEKYKMIFRQVDKTKINRISVFIF